MTLSSVIRPSLPRKLRTGQLTGVLGAVDAALDRLLHVVPPPERRNTDCHAAEEQLGVPLPTDYKELIRTYGGSNWDDYLYLLEPGCPNDNYDLVE